MAGDASGDRAAHDARRSCRRPPDPHLRLPPAAAEAVAPSLAIELVPSPVQTPADIERVIEFFAQAPNGGLFLPPNNTTYLHRDRIIALAVHHRLPAVYAFRISSQPEI